MKVKSSYINTRQRYTFFVFLVKMADSYQNSLLCVVLFIFRIWHLRCLVVTVTVSSIGSKRTHQLQDSIDYI